MLGEITPLVQLELLKNKQIKKAEIFYESEL